jgi:ribosomal protein L14E/L6E/L27E
MKDTRYKLYKKALPLIIHDPKNNDFDKFMKEHFKSEAELEKLLKSMEKKQDLIEEQRFEKMKDFL